MDWLKGGPTASSTLTHFSGLTSHLSKSLHTLLKKIEHSKHRLPKHFKLFNKTYHFIFFNCFIGGGGGGGDGARDEKKRGQEE